MNLPELARGPSFLWPHPAGCCWRCRCWCCCTCGCCAGARSRRVRYASLSIVREAAWAPPALRRHIPPLLFLLALVACCWPRAPGGRGHAALQPADHHAGHGRVGQHARHRRGAQPPGGRAGRRQGLHLPTCRATCGGHRGVCRRPRWRSCPRRTAKTWSPPSTASSCSAPRPPATHRDLAGHAVPQCRHRHAAAGRSPPGHAAARSNSCRPRTPRPSRPVPRAPTTRPPSSC
jgi:hypothetical protein